MKTLVVLPSYNERDNITRLIDALLALGPDYAVCVVDDNSPDGTAAVIRGHLAKLTTNNAARVHLMVREKKDGRGGAVRAGIAWGLEQVPAYGVFAEMDCDFSHPPTDVPRGVAMLADADVVMGSRYPDGKVVGWPIKRRVFSAMANLLARSLISWKIADYTNGFRFYNRASAELMCRLPQKYKGYIYLSETIVAFLRHNMKIVSFPILFVNRQRGESNTTLREVRSALSGLLSIAWDYRFGKGSHTA